MSDIRFRDVQDRFALWAGADPGACAECAALRQALAAAHADLARLGAERQEDRRAITRLLGTVARLSHPAPPWWVTLAATVWTRGEALGAWWARWWHWTLAGGVWLAALLGAALTGVR